MKKIIILIVTALITTGCIRRPLEDEYKETALIPVVVDWSQSGVNMATMHRATVMLFPQDGGKPIEYYLESSLTYREIAVPVGVYSVVVINETADPNEWNGVKFINTSDYEHFAAIAIDDPSKWWYIDPNNLPIIKNPEELAAWSLDRFEVTKQMVLDTRYVSHNNSGSSRVQSLTSIAPDLTNIKPTPRFEQVEVTAQMNNLTSVMQIAGTLDRLGSGVYIVSGDRFTIPSGVHSFAAGKRVYATNGKDGTIIHTFNIFGQLENETHQMCLYIMLTDGTIFPRRTYASEQHTTTAHNIVTTHYIYVEGIDLPDINMENSILVDDWDDVDIIIKN